MNSNSKKDSSDCVSGLVELSRSSSRGVQMELFRLLLVGGVLREPCSVDKSMWCPCEFLSSPYGSVQNVLKKLVLEAVYRPTTHAQVSCVEAGRFYLSIYLFFMQDSSIIKTVLNF